MDKKLVIIPIILLALISILSVVSAADSNGSEETLQGTSEAQYSSEPPVNTTRIVFIHHSCGSNWLATGNGNLGANLNANNYYVSDTNYGWDAQPNDNLGDHTDTGDWDLWFNDVKMPYVYNTTSHSAYTTNTMPNPGGENEIIMFKSCYPLSEVGSSINDEKAIYNDLKPYFAAHQDKLFVLITPPGETTVSSYLLTRELCQWLVNKETGWLSDYPGNNVFVFDFYCVLSETDSHHRVVDGVVEYVYAASYDGISPYHNGDDHPNAAGNQKATAEFLPLLNRAYNQWKSTVQTYDVFVGDSIQSAIDAASANDIIIIHDDEGTPAQYNENLEVNKTLTILNAGLVTIHAPNNSLPVVTINSGAVGTIIQGLIINGGSTGIYLNGANNCTLTGNNITSNSWSGIGINGCQGTVVASNWISGNQEGIYILGGSFNSTIYNNTIQNNQFSGVGVDASTNTTIVDNLLIAGNSNGVRLYQSTGNIIIGNNISQNLWCAVVLDGAGENFVQENTLNYNVEAVHLMNNSNFNLVFGNNVTGNSSSWCGISIWNSTNNTLDQNMINGMQEGIYLTQTATSNIVSQNNIQSNLNSAICVDSNSQYNMIINNTSVNLNGNGIRIAGANLNNIMWNVVTGSSWAAICLDNANDNLVYCNTVSGNQEGIYLFNNANNNQIINNTATGNANSGICVNNAINNTIYLNNIISNGNGIRLYNNANENNLIQNNITGQGWAGIVIDNSALNVVTMNTVQSNGEGLYSMSGSSNNLIYQNNFISNTNHNAYEDGTTDIYDIGGVGNYWSDYSGSGPYLIQVGNVDNNPSLAPF
jgi:parallel beta-helix repeat protein